MIVRTTYLLQHYRAYINRCLIDIIIIEKNLFNLDRVLRGNSMMRGSD